MQMLRLATKIIAGAVLLLAIASCAIVAVVTGGRVAPDVAPSCVGYGRDGPERRGFSLCRRPTHE